MTISAAIYVRSSPDCPVTAEHQIEHLRAVATEHGWAVAGVFTDHPMTVKKGRERRPGETALRDAIRHGRYPESLDLVDRPCWPVAGGIGAISGNLPECWCVALARRAVARHGTIEWSVALRHRRHDGTPSPSEPACSNSARAGISTEFASAVWPTANSGAQLEKAKTFLATGKSLREVARLAGISSSAVGRLKNAMGSAAANI